ncbi:hypothetical protein DAI22_11g079500 [Oryza sativa Japonica Group]|jgi:Leucine-rich repeat (LRR) protein|nr:hypothetical protein DAI22_11g079500 [Oryza sativa Japonica Group]
MSSSSLGAMDAPASFSLGAMGPLLRKLDSLLVAPEIRLPKPLKEGIELLKEDLEEIGVSLVEHSVVDSPTHKARFWMDEVRDLSYHIEDCIDTMFSMRSGGDDGKPRSERRHKVGRAKIDGFSKKPKPCTRMARIAELRALVREASERLERYQLGDVCGSSSPVVFTADGRARPLHHGVSANLVGVDEFKTKLNRWLSDEEGPHLKVAAIVGPAGIGKTALATELYRDHRWQFECRAFVRASRKPDMQRLLGGILSQVQRRQRSSDAYADSTVQSLIDNLREHLQDRRYLIIIDGLWETAVWNIANSAFPDVNSFSRILITADIEQVALECCGYKYDYIMRMEPLGSLDSKKVFFNKVFGSEDQCPPELKEVSNTILEKCGGLPLAIISIAGLLGSQPENPVLWDYVTKYLCSSLGTNPTLKDVVKETLNLSYNSLPHPFKTCLLYLGMYPDGHIMLKADLMKQWSAEGFVSANEAKDTEEIVDKYFDELVNRGILEPVEINKNGKVLSCTLHHAVHDLVMPKFNDDKFTMSVDYSQTITGPSTMVRRLSLHFSSTRYATKPAGIILSRVRSLAFFGLLNCMPCIGEFKLLRVLILEFWGSHGEQRSLNLIPVCRLFQLRYLKTSGDVVVQLPAQISGLQYLETLEIDARVSAVPFDLVHLPNLLHLQLQDETKLPDGIGCMRSLRTLQYFDLGNNSVDNLRGLGELTNLQDLHLSYSAPSSNEGLMINLNAITSSLSRLSNLKSLILSPGAISMVIFFDISSIISVVPVFLQRLELLPPICIFCRLPKSIGQLHKLCILKVSVRELLTTDIDNLTGLPSLTVLSLYAQTAPEGRFIFKDGTLPVLKYFKFGCGELCLAFMAGAMPNLQRLKLVFNIRKSEKYRHTLFGIEHLVSLQDIATRIGVDTSTGESDRRAAESAFKETVNKHPRCLRSSLQWVVSTEEESHPLEKQHHKREKGSSAGHGVLEKESVEDSEKNTDRVQTLLSPQLSNMESVVESALTGQRTKIVVKVHMPCGKSRAKAMALAASVNGKSAQIYSSGCAVLISTPTSLCLYACRGGQRGDNGGGQRPAGGGRPWH